MAAATPSAPSLESRVASIVRMQALLFDAPSPGEYDELLDFREDRRSTKIARLVSILGAQEILLGSGAFLRGKRAESAAAEIPCLVRYLRSLLEAERGPERKLAVLPRNLGRSFAAKTWGLPLFGDCRPARPPASGVLLIYSALDRDGRSASIGAARLGPEDRLAYEGPALVVDRAGPWLSMAAASAESPEPEAALGGKGERDEFLFTRYAISLDRRPRRARFRGRRVDPYAFEYAYLFFDGTGAAANVARFSSDLLSGVFHVPLREAERIAEAFSGRLP